LFKDKRQRKIHQIAEEAIGNSRNAIPKSLTGKFFYTQGLEISGAKIAFENGFVKSVQLLTLLQPCSFAYLYKNFLP